MAVLAQYSFKDFTNRSLVTERLIDFPIGGEIVGSCFYQEARATSTTLVQIRKAIFPVGMTGITFRRCNLDNVLIPPGNTVEPDCSTRVIRVQNDLEDWIMTSDVTPTPTEPINRGEFEQLGISIDPADIPSSPLPEPRTLTERRQRGP